jgi:hypothetical protein
MFTPYEQSLFASIEMKGVIDTAFGDGITKERLRMAKELKKSGVPTPIISKTTGLTEIEIDGL